MSEDKSNVQAGEAAGAEAPAGGVASVELTRVSKPDDAGKNKKVSDISEKIDKLIAERQRIDKAQQASRAGNKPFNDKRRTLVGQLKELRGKRSTLLDAASDMQKKVDAIVKKDKDMKQKDKAAQQQLKFRSVEEADSKIAELERKYETTSMTPKEEKEMMKEISQLKQTRRKVEEYLKSKSSSSTGAENIPALRDQIREKRQEADTFKSQIDGLSKELDDLKEKNKDSASKADKLQKKRSEIQTELNALFAERDAVKKEHNAKWKEYKEYLDKLNKQRDAERKQREEEYRKQREEYERRIEEEEMKKKPWEEEIALCDYLISHLEKIGNVKTQTEGDDKEEANGEDKPEIRKSNDDFGGMRAIGKKNNDIDDFLVMGGGKKKNKNKKKAKSDRLMLSLDMLGSFSLLSLTAPGKPEDIPKSIDELKEKRAYYDVLPRAPKKKAEKAATEEAAPAATESADNAGKKKGGKKTVAPPVDSSELFPSLPGAKPTTATPSAASGPSALDRVKAAAANSGAAAAAVAAPAPAPTPAEAAEE
ncbi:Hypothetical Protein FCC1311_013612 [Hondaea fermentalgiana]|uniref:Nuclear segregation protein BFR1 n=1 Tax=Hondaea fermentalgiana TaxID=2315210 RepID=A0A2R5GBN1_9STRA|nr:Hypothetical Protein FCC1311_013612 [Hondaea fermentalgiana]|eukprot:GBG25144.1 Hypothetical Protein FCC1311_013612 [Hondaea fermentalgiana]